MIDYQKRQDEELILLQQISSKRFHREHMIQRLKTCHIFDRENGANDEPRPINSRNDELSVDLIRKLIGRVILFLAAYPFAKVSQDFDFVQETPLHIVY